MELLFAIDGFFSPVLSPALRALLWGILTGAVSMGIYVLVAPQDALKRLKVEQKANKAQLKAYDGDFEGMRMLLKKDVSYSLKLVTASLLPFVVSLAPVVLLMYGLDALYADVTFPTLGAAWTASYEFWFLLSAIVVSLGIKLFFKIA